jgi:mannose-6-phosphate isomerase-like protein (cupin superfamily)
MSEFRKLAGIANPNERSSWKLNESKAEPVLEISEAHDVPFLANLRNAALKNTDFRRVVYTGDKVQFTLMHLPPDGEIGAETHENVEQVFFCASGGGKTIFDGEERSFGDGDVLVIPPGTKHNIVNVGMAPLKFFTSYTPPNHLPNIVHHTKADADADADDEAFGRKVAKSEGVQGYKLPFYARTKTSSGEQWFRATGTLKNGGFSGFMLDAGAAGRSSKKAKKSTLDGRWAREAWDEVPEADVPPKIKAALGESVEEQNLDEVTKAEQMTIRLKAHTDKVTDLSQLVGGAIMAPMEFYATTGDLVSSLAKMLGKGTGDLDLMRALDDVAAALAKRSAASRHDNGWASVPS